MATLYLSAYEGANQVGSGYPVDAQTVSIDANWSVSSAFPDNGRNLYVRIGTDTACLIERGEDPDGTGNTEWMPANGLEYFWLKPGHKIAVKTP